MRPRLRLCPLLLVVLSIVGCTGLSNRNEVFAAPPATVAPVAHADTPVQPAARVPESDPGEDAGLTPDLVYAVLVGQIADQRGNHRVAFTHFLQGARLSQESELAELAARSALALDDAESVQQAVTTWLELDPQSQSAHQIAAYVWLEADDVPAALEHLRQLITLAAAEGENGFIQVARVVARLKPPERRLELMETLTAEEPENADAWFARAIVALGAEREDRAVEAAWRASRLRPDWNEPRVFLVRVLLAQGDRGKAREILEEFVAENPADHALRLLYAQLLVEDQEFTRARNMFEYMLRDKPKEPDVLFALGVLSLQLEDLEAARAYFTRMRDTGKRQGDSAYYLGQVEELAENPDAAATWYGKVEGEHALDSGVRIARIRVQEGNLDRAREILQQLRDQWPEDAVTIYLIEAELMRDADQPRQAMAVYDEALAANPGNLDLLYARGLQALAVDRLDILEQDLRAILEKDPNHADALNALGYSLADQTDRFEEAKSLVERAMAVKADDPAVLDSMGWVQYRLGNLEESVGFLRRAYGLFPDGEIAAHLGEVLWSMGERDEAWRIWEEALAEDPQHEYLLQVIGRHRFSRSD